MKSNGKFRWYAIRTVPGAQRMARRLLPVENETEEQKAERERRFGETLVERSLREAGVDVFMPGFWEITLHQRTNRLLERRFPMLIGYAFVNVIEGDFERVREADGVMCFIRATSERGPMSLPDTAVGGLMLAEFERHRVYQTKREERMADGQKHRRNQLNTRLGLVFPKGRRKKMPLRMMAEAAIDSLAPASRAQVRTILDELQAMDNEMEACRKSTAHLYSAA